MTSESVESIVKSVLNSMVKIVEANEKYANNMLLFDLLCKTSLSLASARKRVKKNPSELRELLDLIPRGNRVALVYYQPRHFFLN
jgi:hypothetical protein